MFVFMLGLYLFVQNSYCHSSQILQPNMDCCSNTSTNMVSNLQSLNSININCKHCNHCIKKENTVYAEDRESKILIPVISILTSTGIKETVLNFELLAKETNLITYNNLINKKLALLRTVIMLN